MRLLLDTHVLLWWLTDHPSLPDAAREAIRDGRNHVVVSAISLAEIGIKSLLGKLDAPTGLPSILESSGFESLAFDEHHAEELSSLPWHHRDPFDRMLIAQARVESLCIVTLDRQFPQYEVQLFLGCQPSELRE